MPQRSPLSRRSFLGGLGLAGVAGGLAVVRGTLPGAAAQDVDHPAHFSGETGSHVAMDANMAPGEVDIAANGFDPMALLTDFDYGKVSTLPDGRTLREYELVAINQTIEIAPGISFSGWSYNGRIPGPTLRCTEGDRLRITFKNGSDHPHSIHFHGIHPAGMDGLEPVPSGGSFVYEFDAEPFGLHLYHCHTVPIRRHIHKGLYGAFIIDPPTARPPAHELVMVMNAFDTNFDGENEVYAVNSIAFHYAKHPIPLPLNELVRVYLVNMTEFDPVNSFHLHANLFHVFRTGTQLQPHEYTDMISMAQGERHILEFKYKFPGQYMFHAHQSEFAELGWMSMFDVSERKSAAPEFLPAAVTGICDLTTAGGL
ncbi:MAG TPA: multicopper oxidase domain-containing protein [Herpetosiphonaceae bacterium]|nr:multicopper oxidase domain-containing protein [Herpetosiphonaceae bacterium]